MARSFPPINSTSVDVDQRQQNSALGFGLGRGGTGLICRLTILGKVREDVGEAAANDAHTFTSAAAQAFKRACAKFGLGRYLYHLPSMWAPYDEGKRQIVDAPRVIAQLYKMARLAA